MTKVIDNPVVKQKLAELKKDYHKLDSKSKRSRLNWLYRMKVNMTIVARQLGLSRQRVHQLARDSARN